MGIHGKFLKKPRLIRRGFLFSRETIFSARGLQAA